MLKQALTCVLKNNCTVEFYKIQRRTPMTTNLLSCSWSNTKEGLHQRILFCEYAIFSRATIYCTPLGDCHSAWKPNEIKERFFEDFSMIIALPIRFILLFNQICSRKFVVQNLQWKLLSLILTIQQLKHDSNNENNNSSDYNDNNNTILRFCLGFNSTI